MSWFSQQWNRFANGFTDEDEVGGQTIKKVEVVWGRERISIQINEQAPNQVTLRQLKELIVQHTSVPYEQIKLVIGGAVMKDDKIPLAAYGIRNGTRIQLIGTAGGVPIMGDRPGAKSSIYDQEGIGKMSKGEEMARKKKEREEDLSEKGLLNRIDEIVVQARKELLPEILEFEQTPKDHLVAINRRTMPNDQSTIPTSTAGNATTNTPIATISSADSTTQTRKEQLAKQHRKLSELLLRSLLGLDGVNVNSEETRKRRKDAVKEIQGYLDRVDATWAQLKEQMDSSPMRGSNGTTAS